MRVLPFLHRSVVVVALAVVGLAAVPAPASADPTQAQPFAVDSGDRCRYGQAEGALAWRFSRPPVYPQVDVKGTLVDNPLPSPIVDPRCGDDGYYSYLRLTAYNGRTVLDEQAVRVDNGTVRFGLTLGDATSVSHIDRVTAQVCRVALLAPERFYCGPVADHFPYPVTR
ncbi:MULTISPECIES: hypothetical protein [unclassified Solwaraspora]|uniref:hypothetical protein n=1 Tax=unclassified Solwaraspora TaxID=2627926 RepID=UPI00259B31C6|nr:hypothetical protein [Solwaraspora sp. WMMA2056]WJK39673.1 hypothetical protein O7608_24960 [Solwaraspora sp. WMMA2056]